MAHHLLAQASFEELFGHGRTGGEGVSLSERAGCVLYAALNVALGVARRGRAPLAELGQLVKRELALQAQRAVEHGRHVARVEIEAVASGPCRVFGVIY